MLNPIAKNDKWDKFNMLRRVVELKENKIHPEIAGMIRELLDQYTIDEVTRQCKEVAGFYIWTKQIIAKRENCGQVATPPKDPQNPKERLEFRVAKQNEIFTHRRHKKH